MAFTFPTSPASGDTFKHGGLEFVYRDSPNRWATNGYPGPTPDPFADFVMTNYTGANYSVDNISMHDEPPFNAGGNNRNFGRTPSGLAIGAGIAADSTATNGVLALWDQMGSGSALLLPTGMAGPSGILGSDLSSFTTNTNMTVHLSDGTTHRASMSSIFQETGGSFGFGGPQVGGNQVMSGTIGFGFSGGATTSREVTRIDFRIPAGNGATGTTGGTATIRRQGSVLATVTSTSSTPGREGSSVFYNFDWGEQIGLTFVEATS